MPLLAADPVTVLREQREALEQRLRAHSTPQQRALRARAIVHAIEGVNVCESTREHGVWPKTVRYWTRAVAAGGPQALRLRTAGRCAAARRASDVHGRANLRGGDDDMREVVGERATYQPMERARNCRRGHTTQHRAEHLAAARPAATPDE
jgi:hypothetical protein